MTTAPVRDQLQIQDTQESHSQDQFSNVEYFSDNSSPSRSHSPGRRCSLAILIMIECFLAPVNILSGMMASEGKGWDVIFVCVFLLWLLLLPIGLVIHTGIRSLTVLNITKSTLWHLGCCILMFYFFSSILQISPSLLPQWIPTILDCGLSLSIGMQSLPRESLRGLRNWAIEVVSSLCGGGQANLRHETNMSLERRLGHREIV